jgi:FKBP-type peptidyl-prolyl cis-trans isomerase FkpA
MNLKKLLFLFTLLASIIACNNDDDNAVDNFDAAAQAIADDADLIEYFKSHYYIPATEEESFGTVDTIMNNEVSLYDGLGDELKIQEITREEIDYKLYYLTLNEGINDNPTRYDSVFVKYRGFTLDSVKFDENISFNTPRAWLDLVNVIQGWKYGFPNFKSGTNISQAGEPITFEDTGKGILFLPSGLAYSNLEVDNGLSNLPIFFHIELAQVLRSDHDNDGILTRYEDINGDGDLDAVNDDTDGDGFPDYFDIDDEGDGVFTIDEDIDGDGDPRNDDSDNDGIPDYFDTDDDGDGILTIDEDIDGDGDPTNDDTDGDGIPNYLDADS